jgi:site-specific recombinase XerD
VKEPDLATLRDSWELSLRAERKSPQTIKSYLAGVDQYLAYCTEHDLPAVLDRRTLARYIDHLLTDRGAQPATARSRQLGVRRFSAWLLEEGEADVDPLLGVKAPKLDSKVIEPLSTDQLKAMLKACAGKDLRDRRDEAIIRLMAETGARAGEVAVMAVDDLDLKEGVATVRRGKGGKGRTIPLGPQVALAIDRYLRVRRTHRLADSPALWLGDRGKPFNYDGLHKSLKYRATLAGVEGFHPHRLRHTAAHRWLAAGGSEQGLMAVAGWTRPDMLMRYTKAQASARAAEEARRLNLGEL